MTPIGGRTALEGELRRPVHAARTASSHAIPSPGRFRPAVFLALLLLCAPSEAETRRVEVPLSIPQAFLERLLMEQVFTGPETTAQLVSSPDSCNEIVLSQPALRSLGGRIVVTAHGRARAGLSMFGTCFRPFDWEGELEVEEDVRVAPRTAVVGFRVTDSRLEGEGRWLAVPALWNWVKPVVHPRLEALRIDLEPLIGDLRSALPLFAARPEEQAARRLAESLALGEARVEERGLVLTLRFDVEAAPPAAAPAVEPPLTAEEIAAFEATLHEWDAFLTFVVKRAGQDALDPTLRATLLAVLLDARHEMVAALAEPRRDGEDRMRSLFRSSWAKLQPALAPLAGGSQGFRYLAFVASGDALAALDAVGPAFGLEISDDGLRRLARMLAPETSEDPLRWSEEVDPVLRQTFDFEEELPALPPPPKAVAEPGSGAETDSEASARARTGWRRLRPARPCASSTGCSPPPSRHPIRRRSDAPLVSARRLRPAQCRPRRVSAAGRGAAARVLRRGVRAAARSTPTGATSSSAWCSRRRGRSRAGASTCAAAAPSCRCDRRAARSA